MERLSGIGASDGISIGKAFIIDRRRVQAPTYHIRGEEVEREKLRFRRALEETDQQLQRLKEKLLGASGEEHSLILEAHQLILRDELLVEKTIRHIAADLINAEWALRRTIGSIQKLFDQVENDYFRERRSDVDFVADQLMVTLTNQKPVHRDPPAESIVVTGDLSPAELVRIHRFGIRALALEVGGRNSHTSIIARSLAIPVVVGLSQITAKVGSGDLIIVDGFRGEVLLCPDGETARRYQRRAERRMRQAQVPPHERSLAAETLDGLRIRLTANIELVDEIPAALAQGAEGVGLYRTEFIYLGRRGLPTEEEHLADAQQVVRCCGDLPVTIRTCDLGVDKLPIALEHGSAPEANPALGLRSIRLCLDQRTLFKTQLRGLLRAAGQGRVRIMFPMVSGVEELRQAREVLEECRAELISEGHAISLPPVGIMVEMPSAAVIADLLAREADFFAIGTNDLTQYALAIDRTNERINHLSRPLHPAILRLIQTVVNAAAVADLPVTVCGEIAADPMMTVLLVGLGVRELSMNPLAIPRVKRVVRSTTVLLAQELARRVLDLSTAREVEETVRHAMSESFPPDLLGGSVPEEDDTQF